MLDSWLEPERGDREADGEEGSQEAVRRPLPGRLVIAAVLLLVLFCLWFYFTGLWHDIQYD